MPLQLIGDNLPRWEVAVGCNGRPSSCFPYGFDDSNLQDISCVGDSWARYINTVSGEIVDCSKFAAQMEKEYVEQMSTAPVQA